MRALLASLCLSFCLVLPGCAVFSGLFEPLHGEKQVQEEPAVKAARTVIDELNGLLIAANSTIGYNIDQGIWNKATATEYQDKVDSLGKQLDRARELLRAGNPLDAKAQAELLRRAITELHRRVSAAAAKEVKHEMETPGSGLLRDRRGAFAHRGGELREGGRGARGDSGRDYRRADEQAQRRVGFQPGEDRPHARLIASSQGLSEPEEKRQAECKQLLEDHGIMVYYVQRGADAAWLGRKVIGSVDLDVDRKDKILKLIQEWAEGGESIDAWYAGHMTRCMHGLTI